MREFTLPGVTAVCLLFDDGVVCGVLAFSAHAPLTCSDRYITASSEEIYSFVNLAY